MDYQPLRSSVKGARDGHALSDNARRRLPERIFTKLDVKVQRGVESRLSSQQRNEGTAFRSGF